MVYKAVFLVACGLSLVVALPAAQEEQVQLIPIEIAQERGDLVASADESSGGGGGGGDGGWGAPAQSSGWGGAQEQSSGWGGAQEQSSGWGWEPPAQKGWGWPKFKYLKFTIPIPILPRIKFGIKGGLKLNAAIQHSKGWGGWRR